MIEFILLLFLPHFLTSDTVGDYDINDKRLECYSCEGAEYESDCQTKLTCLLDQVRPRI